MDNMDMAKLMGFLSKMDKKDLEQGLNKANEILKANDKNKIIDELNKNQNRKD